MNDNELTYTNTDGDTVYTSAFLAKRGTCCKTDCLHCPYGHTLKSYSLKTVEMSGKQIKFANEIVRDSKPVEQSDLTLSLLASGFGKKDKTNIHHITRENLNNFSFVEFKDVICGVIEFSNKLSESASGRAIKKLYLKKEFQNQGLGVEFISHS